LKPEEKGSGLIGRRPRIVQEGIRLVEKLAEFTERVAGGATSDRSATLVDRSVHQAGQPARNLRRKSRLEKAGRFLLMMVSVVLSALAVELFVRCFATVQNVGPSFSTYDASFLRMLKKNLHCVRYTPEFAMCMTTNSLGFRGPELPPAPSDCVLVLGDSQTMGHGVSDGEEYCSLVRKDLEARYGPDRFAVINAGIGGLGNGRWIRILRGNVWGYHPRLVVLQFSSTDFVDNFRERMFKLSPSGELVEYPSPPPGIGYYLDRAVDAIPLLAYSHSIGLIKQAMARNRVMHFGINTLSPTAPAKTSPVLELTFRLVEESIAICRRRGWPVLVLASDHAPESRPDIERLCGRLQVPLIIVPTKRERPDLFFAVDPHWNVKGQRHVASLIEERMAAEGILLGPDEEASTGKGN
jgi:hypothetical protein